MTTSTSSNDIVFYDIKTCSGINPWKTRLALNFKNVAYTSSFVPLPDVPKVRRGLGMPACRKFADGSDFHTLPIISDPATNALIGDSFDIAIYLQKTYPTLGAGDLFPTQTLDFVYAQDPALLVPLSQRGEGEFDEYNRFNTSVDAAFTAHVQLMLNIPFDPATEEESKAIFVKRAGVNSWDDFALTGENRENMLTSFKDMLGELSKLFLKDTSGPFILGNQASYADLIVGGWLRWVHASLPKDELEQARAWHNGVFGKLHDALEKYAEVK